MATATFVGGSPALADYLYCDSFSGKCYVIVGTPGGGGGNGGGGTGGGSGGAVICHDPQGNVIECQDIRGWYDPTSYCYWKKTEPQPPATDRVWEGHQPADGTIYTYTCPYNGGSWLGGSGLLFRASPPPGFGGLPSPITLAAQAISQLPIRGAQIQTAPNVGGAGLVGLPVWLWTTVNTDTWGPQTATASVPGLSVTATANASKIQWVMGDGGSVTCTTPGTPYSAGFGGKPSPDCGYVYSQSSGSQSGGKYTITAVTTWHVIWSGGGQSGALDVTRQSTSTLQIQELQVVTK